MLSFSDVFDDVSRAILQMKRFGCKELEYMMSEVTFVDEKSLSWEMQAACGVSTVQGGGQIADH